MPFLSGPGPLWCSPPHSCPHFSGGSAKAGAALVATSIAMSVAAARIRSMRLNLLTSFPNYSYDGCLILGCQCQAIVSAA